jgi:PAS domain S-box-containing protein
MEVRAMNQGVSPRRSEAFDLSRDMMCTADADGYFTSLNVAWERCLGWTRGELMGRRFIEFVHPDDVKATLKVCERVGERDFELASFENRYLTRCGEWRWLRWTARSDGQTWHAVAFEVSDRKQTEAYIEEARNEGRLLAYAQPIVDLGSGSVTLHELLVRMRGPNGNGADGVIAPDDFLPQAERFGLVWPIDEWMIGRAVALAKLGHRVAVNISAQTLGDPSLTGGLVETLRSAGFDAEKLMIEITETAAIENLAAARAFGSQIAGIGCALALDDFGTGFGSFDYLRALQAQYLKIDRSHSADLSRDPTDLRLVRSIVAIARQFGHRTIAEGVESAGVMDVLRAEGVDYAQGYFVGRPRPVEVELSRAHSGCSHH